MKTRHMVAIIIFCALLIVATVFAQVSPTYYFWPAIYNLSSDLVVTRRTADGVDKVYARMGWGKCLSMRVSQWNTLVTALPTDRYINMRDYADTVFNPAWSSADHENCPQQPQEVKPHWRGSRPTYNFTQAETGWWVRGNRTFYRVVANNPATVSCGDYVVKREDGTASNYRRLPPNAEIYDRRTDVVSTVADHNYLTMYGIMAICRGKDTAIEDYRF